MNATRSAPRPLESGTHPDVASVTITRDKLYPCVARPGPEWRWIYSVSIDGSDPLTCDTSLKHTERVVRKKYPNAVTHRAWGQS